MVCREGTQHSDNSSNKRLTTVDVNGIDVHFELTALVGCSLTDDQIRRIAHATSATPITMTHMGDGAGAAAEHYLGTCETFEVPACAAFLCCVYVYRHSSLCVLSLLCMCAVFLLV